jgi:hypothetical protein
VEPLPLFLVTIARNINLKEILKLNSLNHIIIEVETYRAQTDCYEKTGEDTAG